MSTRVDVRELGDTDVLDFRSHRGIKPEVYYRCPTLESLGGALRSELEKNSQSIIPVEIATEFVFAAASTVTVPATQQGNLDLLGIIPADYPQIVTVEQALCRGIEGKDRLKTQRAVARSFIDVIQAIDGFKYTERQAWNTDGHEGVRFKYVCADSLQARDRHHVKKRKEGTEQYDCGGAVFIKFSTERDAVNVVYRHNPIHRDVHSRQSILNNGNSEQPALQSVEDSGIDPSLDGKTKKKRKRSKKTQLEESNGLNETNVSNSADVTKSPTNKRKKKTVTKEAPVEYPLTLGDQRENSKQPEPPSNSGSLINGSTPKTLSRNVPAKPMKVACVRCKEKKLKCDEAKPTCNQCERGLWTCHYEPRKTRSRDGCMGCRFRKRKCTEEKPACNYCLKIREECEYPT